MKEKTFYKTLLEFYLHPQKAKQCLTDKRLTKVEKLILEAHLKVRNNQNLEALELMQGTHPSELQFVESQRFHVMGIAATNLTHYLLAEKYIHASIDILKNVEYNYSHFMAYNTLFWIYANLNEVHRMEQMIKEMKKIPVANEYQSIRLLRCLFCYYQVNQENESAMAIMAQIEPLRSQFSESDSISYLIDKFMLFVQMEDFQKSYAVLDDMKSYRKYQLSENYKFMKKLLNHLTKDAPIYAYDQDFEEIPALLHQIKVIQSLEENNLQAAEIHWHALKAFSPTTYKDNFEYTGGKCLFSLCLQKHHQKLSPTVVIKTDKEIPKFDALIKLLVNSGVPLAAGYLFEVLWGRLPQDKEDLLKISRLVSRAKKEKDLNIIFRKGTYLVKKAASKKAS